MVLKTGFTVLIMFQIVPQHVIQDGRASPRETNLPVLLVRERERERERERISKHVVATNKVVSVCN